MTNDLRMALLRAIEALAAAPVDDTFLGKTVRDMVRGGTLVALPQEPQEREVVHLKVTLADGSKTNISMPANLIMTAARRMGGEREVRKMVRELARKAPSVNNRSGWVQDQLAQSLAA